MKFILVLSCLVATITNVDSQGSNGQSFVTTPVGSTALIPLPQVATYRRLVLVDGVRGEHLYRVCNGKNKNKCGFWEDVKTKKKVVSGATTYNKNKKQLVVKKILKSDEGIYVLGNNKTVAFSVIVLAGATRTENF